MTQTSPTKLMYQEVGLPAHPATAVLIGMMGGRCDGPGTGIPDDPALFLTN